MGVLLSKVPLRGRRVEAADGEERPRLLVNVSAGDKSNLPAADTANRPRPSGSVKC